MIWFWLLILLTLALVAPVMILLGRLAREVPDEHEHRTPTRLNPDQLRLIAYAFVILLILLASMCELQSQWEQETAREESRAVGSEALSPASQSPYFSS